jgi:predicted metal-dependent enzyme (double-stranded beta helix superfamily)
MAVQAVQQVLTDYNLDAFVADVRRSIEDASTMPMLLQQVKAHLERLVKNPGWLERDHGLPQEGDYRSRILYHDPDYLFAVTASIQKPGHHTAPHDHGEAWAAYGVYRNQVQMSRYERQDDGSEPGHAEIRLAERYVAEPGYVDTIPPFGIHEINNPTEGLSLAIVIRSRHLPDIWRNRFLPERNEVRRVRGGGGD